MNGEPRRAKVDPTKMVPYTSSSDDRTRLESESTAYTVPVVPDIPQIKPANPNACPEVRLSDVPEVNAPESAIEPVIRTSVSSFLWGPR